MIKKSIAVVVAAALGGLSFSGASQAGGVTYKGGDKYVTLGGRIQVQYHYQDPDSGSSTDDLFFRRLRPFIEGSLHPDWQGKFQFDLGSASGDNELAIKDAYIQYTGYDKFTVTLGNKGFPFSREYVTSSKFQQFVERTFVGDHNYGTPEWNLGLHLNGKQERLTWGVSLVEADIDPDNSKVDFDTPVNKNADFNQGWMIGGRMDYHPFGILKFSQGDFERERKLTVGIAAYTWSNDDDVQNNTSVAPIVNTDVDSVNGYEISGAYRNMGISIDAEYNRIDAELKDGTVTGGLYEKGETTLDQWMVKGGYMLMPGTLELVAGYESLDADNYAETWGRYSFGVNCFVHRHDVKYQLTYRQNKNKDGVDGSDESEIFAQAQYVF